MEVLGGEEAVAAAVGNKVVGGRIVGYGGNSLTVRLVT